MRFYLPTGLSLYFFFLNLFWDKWSLKGPKAGKTERAEEITFVGGALCR